MTIREELLDELSGLPDETLAAILEYARFIKAPPEAEPEPDEVAAIARGRAECARGESVNWRELAGKAYAV